MTVIVSTAYKGAKSAAAYSYHGIKSGGNCIYNGAKSAAAYSYHGIKNGGIYACHAIFFVAQRALQGLFYSVSSPRNVCVTGAIVGGVVLLIPKTRNTIVDKIGEIQGRFQVSRERQKEAAKEECLQEFGDLYRERLAILSVKESLSAKGASSQIKDFINEIARNNLIKHLSNRLTTNQSRAASVAKELNTLYDNPAK